MPTNHGLIWQHSSFSPTVVEKLLQVVNPRPKNGLHPTIRSTMSTAGRYIQWHMMNIMLQIFNEICVNLVFKLRTALFCVITQWVVVISYRCFGTTYQSHLHDSRIRGLSDFWTLKMGPIGCPEMLVTNYHYLLRNSFEECSSHLHGRSLKPCTVFKLSSEHVVVTYFTPYVLIIMYVGRSSSKVS